MEKITMEKQLEMLQKEVNDLSNTVHFLNIMSCELMLLIFLSLHLRKKEFELIHLEQLPDGISLDKDLFGQCLKKIKEERFKGSECDDLLANFLNSNIDIEHFSEKNKNTIKLLLEKIQQVKDNIITVEELQEKFINFLKR